MVAYAAQSPPARPSQGGTASMPTLVVIKKQYKMKHIYDLKQLVIDDISQAIFELKKITEERKYKVNEILIIENQWKNMSRKRLLNTESVENINIETNKIIDSILLIIDELFEDPILNAKGKSIVFQDKFISLSNWRTNDNKTLEVKKISTGIVLINSDRDNTRKIYTEKLSSIDSDKNFDIEILLDFINGDSYYQYFKFFWGNNEIFSNHYSIYIGNNGWVKIEESFRDPWDFETWSMGHTVLFEGYINVVLRTADCAIIISHDAKNKRLIYHANGKYIFNHPYYKIPGKRIGLGCARQNSITIKSITIKS